MEPRLKKIGTFIAGRRVVCYLCIGCIAMILLHDSIWGKMELMLPDTLLEAESGTKLTLCGEIVGLEQKEYSQYIYMESDSLQWLIYDYEFQTFSIGSTIQVTGELELFDVARNPGNFNMKGYYNAKGIVAGIKAESIVVVEDEVAWMRNHLYELRLKGVAHIYEILEEEEASLLVAMVFGEKNGMDDEQEELFQKIGISHIFAISGLHISLISLVVYQMIRRWTGSFLVAGSVSGVFLVLYLLLIGMGVSAMRAGIMFFMRVGADISGRVYDRRTSLALAALCILIPNPLYLYEGSFLLSFGAILGVIYLVPIWEEVFSRMITIKNTAIENITKGIGTSIGIQCMILPILLYFYYEVSPYSILLNLIVVPVMTVLLGAAFIGIAIGLVWYELGAVFIRFSGILLQIIDKISDKVLGLYGSRIILGKPWMWMIVLYYIGIVGLIIYNKMRKTVQVEGESGWNRYGGIVCGFCLLPCVLLISDSFWNPVDLTITMLDVGQGDSFVIQNQGGSIYMIDGGSTDLYDVGKYRIESYLRSEGIAQVDYVFISHGDADHLNGIAEMLERQDLGVRIGTVVLCMEEFQDDALIELAAVAAENDTQVAMMAAGSQMIDGALEITCLAPLATYSGELGNESSMILEVCMNELQVLFTGDVEGEGEEQLIELLSERKTTYQILKVAHHGSSNSTNAEFLDLVQADIALISAGVDSVYGHPHEATLSLLEDFGCSIYTTSVNGGVVLSYKSNDGTISIEETIVIDE